MDGGGGFLMVGTRKFAKACNKEEEYTGGSNKLNTQIRQKYFHQVLYLAYYLAYLTKTDFWQNIILLLRPKQLQLQTFGLIVFTFFYLCVVCVSQNFSEDWH